jgi:2,3-bisphosphoglycerate-dependent phosphoglycerate mutase
MEQNEDGYEGYAKKSLFRRLAGLPLWKRMRRQGEPGCLVLVRHGESTWNANQTFTGWADADLSEQGVREVEHAARLLLEGGYAIDIVFTSRLKRAIKSVWILLQEMNQIYLPVFKSWRLNERMYGALTGLSKKETAEKLGPELVQSW